MNERTGGVVERLRGGLVAVSSHDGLVLGDGWLCCATPPDAVTSPSDLSARVPEGDWVPALVPGTAASSLRAAERWSLDGPERRFDAEDWWWRLRFEADAGDQVLCFDGVATVAECWLDGEPLATSDNMFLPFERAVNLEAGSHELVLRCRSLDALLKARRPRPRWRAPMVEHQRLCWFRATLLGRTPGWSPPAAAVGPWRPVRLERRRELDVETLRVTARPEGEGGRVQVQGQLRALDGAALGDARLELERAGERWQAPLELNEEGALSGEMALETVARWWPHSHGEPALYQARIVVGEVVLTLADLGFREVALDTDDGGFRVLVNGEPIFCRGACWTPLDPVTLHGGDLRAALEQVADAGMNMIRVGGTMVYEEPAFYALCDELGILVWQDLMFANMDYAQDEDFLAGVEREVRHQLARLAAHPSVAVFCGNSEGEQQAAMWGAARESWAHPLFSEVFAALAAEHAPGSPYWPSSAHGGAYPHQCDRGTTSYYGVGAYLRPLEDARRSDLRFATEALAFANLPATSTLERMPGGLSTRVHQPGYKARTPRDLGAGWDFDDVRDHYLAALYGVDPGRLRYAEHDRYLALGRVVVGHVMAASFAEWRREESRCGGVLLWFLRDLWRGAGWGVIDADGLPKSAYWFLRRALQPVSLHATDEGNNGVALHLVNERATGLEGILRLTVFKGVAQVGEHAQEMALGPRSARSLNAAEVMEGFFDLAYAFRFGPPPCDLLRAQLVVGDDVVAECFHWPLGLPRAEADLGLAAVAQVTDDEVILTLSTRRHAHAVAIETPGYLPDDDFLHLAPGDERRVRLTKQPGAKRFRGSVVPANAFEPVRIEIAK